MAKKQSRRSISVSRPIYEHVKVMAQAQGISAAQLVEDALRAFVPDLPASTGAALGTRRHWTVISSVPPEKAIADRVAADSVSLLRTATPPPRKEITNPCRRERCGVLALHNVEDCARLDRRPSL